MSIDIKKILNWIISELKIILSIIAAILIVWQVYGYGYKHGKNWCESELGARDNEIAIIKDSLIFDSQISPSHNELQRANLRKGTSIPIFDGQGKIFYRDIKGSDLNRKAEILVIESEPQDRRINQTGSTWLTPADHTIFTVETVTTGYNIRRKMYLIDFLGFFDDIEKDLAKIIVFYKSYEDIDPKEGGDLVLDSTILIKGDSLFVLNETVQIKYKDYKIREGRKWPVITLSGREKVVQFRSAFRSKDDIIPFRQEKEFYALNFLGFVDTLTSEDIYIQIYQIKN